ncbi:BnaC06g41510D [Brassica napus]|uniref:BnaC06g41510D protein n=1 Tax=Brassica napus TaxID=3708 RepID=A0A078DDU8_BRANA|nr:BnaC06g41510D [Brassica napus]
MLLISDLPSDLEAEILFRFGISRSVSLGLMLGGFLMT